jgi:hypothetical protein
MDDGAMTAKDVASLPHRLQASARIDANGEVSWPLDKVRDAISELAKSGHVVLGLDMRDYDAEGLFIEVAWSVYGGNAQMTAADIEPARVNALDAVNRAVDFGGWREAWVLISWRSVSPTP